MADESTRFDQKITLTSNERGRVTMRIVDRITVDDVFLHLVNRELYRIATGSDPGSDVDQSFKEFLMRVRFSSGSG